MRIAKRYFKRLIIDLPLVFPFELIRMQFHASNLKYLICSLLRLVRLFRFGRVLSWLSEFEKSDKINFTLSRALRMILVCCFAVHYWVCIFYYAATFNDNSKRMWIGS
jgi:hypothetical protein